MPNSTAAIRYAADLPTGPWLGVDAPNYLLTTLTMPLAEKGYYVFRVQTAKTVLEQEGFFDGDQVQKQPPEMLAQLFGADAVLFVTINRWDAQYAVLATTVTVDFDCRLVYKDGHGDMESQQEDAVHAAAAEYR